MVCERAFLTALDGSCKTPIAGWARVSVGGGEGPGGVALPVRCWHAQRTAAGGDRERRWQQCPASSALNLACPCGVAWCRRRRMGSWPLTAWCPPSTAPRCTAPRA